MNFFGLQDHRLFLLAGWRCWCICPCFGFAHEDYFHILHIRSMTFIFYCDQRPAYLPSLNGALSAEYRLPTRLGYISSTTSLTILKDDSCLLWAVLSISSFPLPSYVHPPTLPSSRNSNLGTFRQLYNTNCIASTIPHYFVQLLEDIIVFSYPC